MTRKINIAMHQMNYTTGAFEANFLKTKASIQSSLDADIHVLPECAVTNYASDDYFLDAQYQAKTLEYCERYRQLSAELGTTIVVGTPLRGKTHGKKMGNGLVVSSGGREVASYLKSHLPNYDVFDDVRWFESRLEQTGRDAEINVLEFPVDGNVIRLGFCICEDIWFSDVTAELKEKGAEIIISINSSPYAIAKGNFRRNVFKDRVSETGVPLVYVNQVGGNDELVWDGCSAVLDPDGVLYEIEMCKEGVEVVMLADAGKGFRNTVSKPTLVLNDQQERYLMASLGLHDYIEKNGFHGVLFGLSGGMDSSLVAAMAVDIFGEERVNAAMMPSPYTSPGSNMRAARLAAGMGNGFLAEVWPITEEYEAAKAKFRKVRGIDPGGLADENLQAQIRGNTLSMISNDAGGKLAMLGTSNKSEILCGYGTLYGDLRGAFNVLKDLYKSIDVFPLSEMRLDEALNPDPTFQRVWLQTFGRRLAKWTTDCRAAMREVIDEPPSAELKPGQKDTDSLPPYPRLDRVLWEIEDAKTSQTDEEIAATLGEDVAFVTWVRAKRRTPEFKRFQSCPGVKIHRKSPTTKDRRMPLTCHFA
ncbi:NAD(+) synthase [Agrobacterium salinitolerans]|nr:NAD(+) synthase [Agrobacterium salinitolerans]